MSYSRFTRTAFVTLFAISALASAYAEAWSLDSCRALALQNNKTMRIMSEEIRKAGYQKDQAFAAYLPAFDFNGGYVYNQRNISIFDSDQLLPVKSFNLETKSYEFSLVTNPLTGKPVTGPDGQPIPADVAYLPKDAMTYDIHNIFFGAITLTQPVFMGGKIVAMNKITGYAEQLARELHNAEAQNMVYAVDAAYWQVVSLRAKKELAESYIALLDTLRYDVTAMIEEGVATPADLLSVEVKLNSAEVDLVKVDNGLALSRMALAQLCGLPVDTPMTLVDEGAEPPADADFVTPEMTMQQVWAERPDLRALDYGVEIRRQQQNVERAAMLPQIALIGAYTFSNPNMYDGFKHRFAGAFSVGATLSIPLWHWGGNYNKYRAAQADVRIAELALEDAREMVTLQVSQARFKVDEALKTRHMTTVNIAKADKNLENALLGYTEGVMTLTNVMEAQTAWLKARSEKIDADIDVQLCHAYLLKSLGTL